MVLGRGITMTPRALVVAVLLLGCSPVFAQSTDPYQGIPKGHDFPAPQARLLQLRDAQDVEGMRRHVWELWSGLNSPTKKGGPVWETWYRADDVFAPPRPQSLRARSLSHKFEPPRQFLKKGAAPEAMGQSLFSFVLFNQESQRHVRENQYWNADVLQQLHDQYKKDNTPPDKRVIKPFPAAAVAVKTAWWPVAKDARTPVPVWDYDPKNPIQNGNDWNTWKRFILVDPMRKTIAPDEVGNGTWHGKTQQVHVVPLSRFYAVQMTQEEVDAANASFQMGSVARDALGRDLQAGDWAVLVGMHVTTKEIPDWVWATFFWHDHPERGPKAMDRTASVKGVWRNYLMDTSYDVNVPRQDDGSPHIAYNPWLEARFPDGPLSNCMACHRRSSWPLDFNSVLPITRGDPPPANDPAFRPDQLRLDFLWSVADRAVQLPPPPQPSQP
jgi:hypothetical protein